MVLSLTKHFTDTIGTIKYDKQELILWQDSWTITDPKGKRKRVIPINLHSEICNRLEDYNEFKADTHLYIWNINFWDMGVQQFLYKWIENIYVLLKVKYSEFDAKEIEKILKNRHGVKDSLVFNNRTDYIPFQNGYFHIQSKTLQPARPDLMFTYCFQHDLDLEHDCPKFKEFMEEFMPNVIDREDILRFLSYGTTSHLDIQKALILHGSGSNGKTVFFEILVKLWEGLYCKIPLQKLDEQFVRVNMRDKLLNIVADLPSKRLQDEGAVKECITDISLEDDEKYFPRARWRNVTKHIYGCNKIPLPPFSPTDGFYRRWIIKKCAAIFKDINDKDFDPKLHKPIKDFKELLRDITAEASAIFGYILSFIDSINLLRTTNLLDIRAEWNKHSENILCFLNEQCELDPDFTARVSIFYSTYCKWCKDKNLVIMSIKGVSMAVQDQGISSELKQITYTNSQKDRVKYYYGVKIKESCPYLITSDETKQDDVDNSLRLKQQMDENEANIYKIILKTIESYKHETFTYMQINEVSKIKNIVKTIEIMQIIEKEGIIFNRGDDIFEYIAKSCGEFIEFEFNR